MARGRSIRQPTRRRRGPPNWITVLVTLTLVGLLYWFQGPADSPWKAIRPGARPAGNSTSPTSGKSSDAGRGESDPSKASGAGGERGPDGVDGGPERESERRPEDGSDADRPPGKAGSPGKDGPPGKTVTTGKPDTTGKPGSTGLIVKDVTIRDRAGKVVYQGNIDLAETMSRIDRGEKLEFPNDGSIFQNRERRLPSKPTEYYREWVHRTPRLPGPGPQRVVTGKGGEAYYTPDHYETFQQVR